ncbi:hypothetical protein MKX03_028638 [Papaver bracteatum]|nr:hypothetical protein MKX03_028638 [Papaver bracteatum]
MENLSSDIVLEILSRLPKTREGIKSILQCRKVCRLWRSLLGKPKPGMLFAHHPRYDSDIKLYYKEQSSEKVDLNFTDERHTFYKSITKRGTEGIVVWEFSLVGSCNGLICYKTYEYTLDKFVYILNPITNENTRLPKIDPYCECVGFGYCHSTNVYKIVQTCYSETSKRRVLVYTLGDGRGWREIEKTTYNFLGPGIFGHGALYWLSTKSENVVVAFDLADETFRYIPSPPCHHIPSESYMKGTLASLGGNLYMCRSCFEERKCMMNLFIFMKKNMNNCTTHIKERTYFNSYRWINVFGVQWDLSFTEECQLLTITESEILLFQNDGLSCYHPTTFKKI